MPTARRTTAPTANDATSDDWLGNAIGSAKVSTEPLTSARGPARSNPFDELVQNAYESDSKIELDVPNDNVSRVLNLARRAAAHYGLGLGTHVETGDTTSHVELKPKVKRARKVSAAAGELVGQVSIEDEDDDDE